MINLVPSLVGYLIAVGTGASAGLVFFYLALRSKWQQADSLQATAKKMLHESKKDADRIRREATIKAKEDLYQKRSEYELEIKRQRSDLELLRERNRQRKEMLDQEEQTFRAQRREFESKERELAKQLDVLRNEEEKVNKLYNTLIQRLEQVSSVSKDEAKRMLVETIEHETRHESLVWVQKIEDETRIIAKEKSIEILVTAMQRYLADQVTLHSSSVVHLPNEEIKGKIIGKEGRNIRTLEMATGMEFIIGDAPEVITISGFNPVRREIAKRTLTLLVQDGRINPTRIEEVVEQCEKEMNEEILEHGKQSILEFGLHGVHPEIVALLGKLYFRTSYTQNVLVHSKEVAYFASLIAGELGLNPNLAARCGLLHDIGKAVTGEIEGPHAAVGAQIARQYGEDPIVVNAIAAHLEEVPYTSIYSVITHIADAISASRPGARRETLSAYIKRLEQLEQIAKTFEGVKKSFALQAGREIRVIVNEADVSDEQAALLAKEIARKIETEMSFPGQIKVNVIRESRVIEYAR